MTPERLKQRLEDNKAVLIDHKVVPVGLDQWAKTFEKADRRVALTVLNRRRHIHVSTVFLGLDHGWGERPLWFETMVFGTSIDEAMDRYETWDEAVAGHARMVRRARQARQTRKVRVSFRKTMRLLRQNFNELRRNSNWRN